MDAIVGSHIISLDSIDSTNNFAAKMLESIKPANGTAILASFQEKGRGQRGAAWQSVKGLNFLCSIIIYPDYLKAHEQFYLSKVVALSIQSVIESYGIDVCRIKWPNDIFISDKKCWGILIENSLRGDKIESSIIGLGLNINQDHFEIPQATSLKKETGRTIDLNSFRELVFKAINEKLGILCRKDFTTLDRAYQNKLYGTKSEHFFLIGNEKKRCTFSHVDQSGSAYLKCENEILGPYSIREIKLIQP